MRLGIAMLWLCDCNRVFGLDPTLASPDARSDASIDAPYHCPALGMAPELSPQLHQLDLDCDNYTLSEVTRRAIASCRQTSASVISEGLIDGPLSPLPLPGLPTATADFSVYGPRLSADGDLLFVSTYDLATLTAAQLIFHRDTAGTWTRGIDFPIPNVAFLSVATHGPDHHVIYSSGATNDLHEASDASGSWVPVATFTIASLAIPSAGAIWLSSDGLRMIIAANVLEFMGTYLVYTDRPALGQPFRPATRLQFGGVPDPFMTEGCSRLYFSGLRSIFYANQR